MNKNILKKLVLENKSTYEIALQLNCSQTNIRYWLKKFELKTNFKQEKNAANYFCKFCGEKNKDKFCNKGNGIISFSKCKVCHNKQTIERFRKYKLQAINYKGGKCVTCGYNKCPGSLHFHHVEPNKKDPNWKQMRNWKFDKIKNELDKCILVCGNCHGEIHWNVNDIVT